MHRIGCLFCGEEGIILVSLKHLLPSTLGVFILVLEHV